ncbi:MAG: hypothetical protein V1872_11400 [bacterium]
MDKILSTRVDESILSYIKILAERLHISKKKVIESAVMMYMKSMEEKEKIDLFDQTFGVWKREESANEIIEETRGAFQKSMTRYQK